MPPIYHIIFHLFATRFANMPTCRGPSKLVQGRLVLVSPVKPAEKTMSQSLTPTLLQQQAEPFGVQMTGLKPRQIRVHLQPLQKQ